MSYVFIVSTSMNFLSAVITRFTGFRKSKCVLGPMVPTNHKTPRMRVFSKSVGLKSVTSTFTILTAFHLQEDTATGLNTIIERYCLPVVSHWINDWKSRVC